HHTRSRSRPSRIRRRLQHTQRRTNITKSNQIRRPRRPTNRNTIHTTSNTPNTEPTCATPDTTGNTEFTGGVDGTTEKLDALVAVPPGVVTAIGPLVALEGTVAVICVAELTVKVAAVPWNVTAVAP